MLKAAINSVRKSLFLLLANGWRGEIIVDENKSAELLNTRLVFCVCFCCSFFSPLVLLRHWQAQLNMSVIFV